MHLDFRKTCFLANDALDFIALCKNQECIFDTKVEMELSGVIKRTDLGRYWKEYT